MIYGFNILLEKICDNRRLNSDDLQFYQYQPKYSHRSPHITELNKDHDIWRWHFMYWSGTKCIGIAESNYQYKMILSSSATFFILSQTST
jgi:hypothetical protein